ncbi:MAG: 16S rRNA (cytosine(967)-C(5))-methyltransferase RsmB [Xanthomonadales bacterium]|nr:Ribosomal RNA small subunit methyltransferase B [Xanthomonadales bacterium]MCC6594084.1 16S rRNA (cytosine(967)-C(5))-methyltransferase RsmB [Xanthomonadales bacterium]MCE7930166.1 16S rRNA (cytosine(967)-C(5))-methyltransferase RsmB [Xanthomonadales bacterium PRO6]
MTPLRLQLAQALHRVEGGQSLDAVIAALPIPAADLPFARALLYQALRRHYSNAALLRSLVRRAPKPVLAALLRLALAELRFLATPAHAAVAESVNAARALQAQAAGFANAVLRRFLRERQALEAALANDEEARLEHPRWLIEAFRRDWPAATVALCAAGNHAAPMWLRVDARSGRRSDYLVELAARGIAAVAPEEAPPYALRLLEAVAVERLPGFAEGRVSVQDAAAQWVVEALDARPGERVLDACAAPGGKTAALAERVPGLALDALEIDPVRAERLRRTLQRCRVDARLLVADATRPPDWWDGQPYARILIDAPCSGTGVIRRHPDIKLLRRAGDIQALAARQSALLDALWPLLAVGGRLTYATCSVLAVENQAQIAAFCQRTPSARALPLALPGFSAAGPGWQQFSGHGDQDGFFYVSLLRCC